MMKFFSNLFSMYPMFLLEPPDTTVVSIIIIPCRTVHPARCCEQDTGSHAKGTSDPRLPMLWLS